MGWVRPASAISSSSIAPLPGPARARTAKPCRSIACRACCPAPRPGRGRTVSTSSPRHGCRCPGSRPAPRRSRRALLCTDVEPDAHATVCHLLRPGLVLHGRAQSRSERRSRGQDTSRSGPLATSKTNPPDAVDMRDAREDREVLGRRQRQRSVEALVAGQQVVGHSHPGSVSDGGGSVGRPAARQAR